MEFFGMTDKGKIRTANQDRFIIHSHQDNKYVFAAVCDGMGGASGGEVASSMAIETIEQEISALGGDYPRRQQWNAFIRNIASEANRRIFELSLNNEKLFGMGTTFVSAICNNKKALIANVGDSKAYLITEEDIVQISKDHSLIDELIEKGQITQEEAKFHPSKNVITRALGVDTKVKCDVYSTDIVPGSFLLLCSDGLTEEVSIPEIHFEVCNGNSVKDSCKTLIDLANSRGGHDNITVVLGAF